MGSGREMRIWRSGHRILELSCERAKEGLQIVHLHVLACASQHTSRASKQLIKQHRISSKRSNSSTI